MQTPAEGIGLGGIKEVLGGKTQSPQRMPLRKSPQKPPPGRPSPAMVAAAVIAKEQHRQHQQHEQEQQEQEEQRGSSRGSGVVLPREDDGATATSFPPFPSFSSSSSPTSSPPRGEGQNSMDDALEAVHVSMRFMSLVYLAHMVASALHILCYATLVDEGRRPIDALLEGWPRFGHLGDVGSWVPWTKALFSAVLACVKPHQPYATDAVNSGFFAVYLFRGSKDFRRAIEAKREEGRGGIGGSSRDGGGGGSGSGSCSGSGSGSGGGGGGARDELLTDGMWELAKIFRKMRIPKIIVTLKVGFAAVVPICGVLYATTAHIAERLQYHYGTCLPQYDG